MNLLEQVQKRVMIMVRSWKSSPLKKGLREFVLLSMEKRRLGGNLVVVSQYLEGAFKEDKRW